MTPHRSQAGAGWCGVFNRDGANPREIVLEASVLGIAPGSRLYDIWARQPAGDLGQPVRLVLPPDEVLFVRYAPG